MIVAKKVILFSVFAVFMELLWGCASNSYLMEAQTIVATINNEDVAESVREVTDKTSVKKVDDIIQYANWEKSHVEMSRREDYKFHIQYEDESNSETHLVWISPKKNRIEIVVPNEKYVRLSAEDSRMVHEIITGAKLGE